MTPELRAATAMQSEVLPLETGTDIVAAIEQSPQIALLDQAKYSAFFKRVKAETETLVPDTSTTKGRDEIRAMAAKVIKTKSAIDKARLTLTAQWRDQTTHVNAAGKTIEAELKQLAADVRKPLTDWETADDARKDRCRAVIDGIKADMAVGIDDTAAQVRERGARVYGLTFGAVEFAGFEDEAKSAKTLAVDTLKSALALKLREEADRAELEELRTAKAEQEAKDEALRAEQEKIERRRDCARRTIEHIKGVGLGTIGGKSYPYAILFHELEEKIVITEDDFGDMAADVERARVETLARLSAAMVEQAERSKREDADRAANAAREDEARKSREVNEKREREHQQALAAERKRAANAERAAQDERDRTALVEKKRAAANEAIAFCRGVEDGKIGGKSKPHEALVAALESIRLNLKSYGDFIGDVDEACTKAGYHLAQVAREANQEHKTRIKAAAKAAIMSCGADEDTARKIVLAIMAGEVPAVRLEF